MWLLKWFIRVWYNWLIMTRFLLAIECVGYVPGCGLGSEVVTSTKLAFISDDWQSCLTVRSQWLRAYIARHTIERDRYIYIYISSKALYKHSNGNINSQPLNSKWPTHPNPVATFDSNPTLHDTTDHRTDLISAASTYSQ